MTRSRSLVSASWLFNRLKSPSSKASPPIRVIDASWYLPTSSRDPAKEFTDKRIPTSRFFDIDATCDTTSCLPHMLPPPNTFADAVEKMGISKGDEIIVYDGSDDGIFSSPRVWWMLRHFGLDNVSVLNGGLNAWELCIQQSNADDMAFLERGDVTETLPGNVGDLEAVVQSNDVIGHTDMKAQITSGGAPPPFQILDARSTARFTGKAKEPRTGVRSGHMPYSISIPYTKVLDPTKKTLLTPDEIDQVLQDQGVQPNVPIVLSCGSGVTACVLALAIENSSFANCPYRLYDGSWSQWGGDPDTPVLTEAI